MVVSSEAGPANSSLTSVLPVERASPERSESVMSPYSGFQELETIGDFTEMTLMPTLRRP